MDLRTRKTRRALRGAFLEMRATRPLEKVTVRELCERAETSKATFYLHYHSVVDLSRELQEAVVSDIVSGLGETGGPLADPRRFTRELFMAFIEHADEIDVLFSRGQEHALIESVERELRRRILSASPELESDMRFNMLLTYQVHGSHATYMRYARGVGDEGRRDVVDAISEASAAVASLW